MPSHTFTRVGLWKESIETNRRSAEAARKENATPEELHAMDYQAYAYLQIAQDAAARRIADEAIAAAGRLDVNATGVGCAGRGRRVCHGGHSRPLCARTQTRGPKRPSLTVRKQHVPAHRCDHSLRTSARSRTIGQSKGRRRRHRAIGRPARRAEDDAGCVLGRAGGHPAPDRDRVGRPLRKATGLEASSSCAPRPRPRMAPTSRRFRLDRWRPRASCSVICCSKPGGPQRRSSNSKRQRRRNPTVSAVYTAPLAPQKRPASARRAVAFYKQLLQVASEPDTNRPELEHARNFIK